MKIAFALFRYFPFGGLQKDMLHIARACQEHGCDVSIFCREWQGERPDNLDIHILPVTARSNHGKNRQFIAAFRQQCQQARFDCIVGFNKMPGLDVYYAADTCFKAKLEQERPAFYRFLPRYRAFIDEERAVFAPEAKTRVLCIAERSMVEYQACHGTPRERFTLLPPGISRDRQRPADSAQRREQLRRQLGCSASDNILLFIGSGFRTKGLDRAIRALAALPEATRQQTRFWIVGEDRAAPFEQLATRLGIRQQLHFLGGRSDVPDFLVAADLLIHPAYRENTGTVLLEAAIAGLPVLTTSVCGYAHYIEEFDCGLVLNEPYEQAALDHALLLAMDAGKRLAWQQNGLRLAAQDEIYTLAEKAADAICATGANHAEQGDD